MRRKLVAGNWKMNGSLKENQERLDALKQGVAGINGVDIAVFPPFVYIDSVRQALSGTSIKWGGQNVSDKVSGAYTGEISVSMLLDLGCAYALVGHSERRSLYGETDQVVASKFAVARKAGLAPMLCVGETLEEREAGTTENVVARQLDAILELEGIQSIADCVIAYEPVWAIGTGKTATPEQAQEVHAFIRSHLARHDAKIADSAIILYGGSVKGSNAAELFKMPDIDGGLVGGASLNAAEFLQIVKGAL